MDIEAFFRDYITTWEGGLSLDPDDRGNWYAAPGGASLLVGSKHGVTGATLAAWRGTPVSAADMAALTLDEAVRIGRRFYYERPGFTRLPWDPLVASLVDFGWGAGPEQAVRLLQRLTGVADDGILGPITAAAYRRWVAGEGLEGAARAWLATRKGFYRDLVLRRPKDGKYLRGWLRRSDHYAPGGSWWRRFERERAA